MQNKTILIIPFYNEEQTILQVCKQAIERVDLIIAIDDGSTDKGAEKISSLKNLILLKHKFNKGKGAALKTGFLKSIELASKITISMDADLQHDPKYLNEFIKQTNNFDVVLGNRLNDVSLMPIHRKISNYLTSFLISLKTGVNIPDSQCGFRAFKTELLKKILPDGNGFEAESEMIIRAAKAGYSFGFVDIPTIYGGDNSKMKNVSATFGFLRTLLKRY